MKRAAISAITLEIISPVPEAPKSSMLLFDIGFIALFNRRKLMDNAISSTLTFVQC